jgi:hypothetical protein
MAIECQSHVAAGEKASPVEVQRFARSYIMAAAQRKGRGKQENEPAYNAGDNDESGEGND